MSLFDIFTGKKPQAYEQKGDTYAKDGLWGNAKVEYERAMSRLESQASMDSESADRLATKVAGVREELAREHQSNAKNLVAGGYGDEAHDLFSLALELTRDAGLEKELQEEIDALENVTPNESALNEPLWDSDGDDGDENSRDWFRTVASR